MIELSRLIEVAGLAKDISDQIEAVKAFKSWGDIPSKEMQKEIFKKGRASHLEDLEENLRKLLDSIQPKEESKKKEEFRIGDRIVWDGCYGTVIENNTIEDLVFVRWDNGMRGNAYCNAVAKVDPSEDGPGEIMPAAHVTTPRPE